MSIDRKITILNQNASSQEGSFELASFFTQKLENNEELQNPWVNWKRDTVKLSQEIYTNRNRKLSGLIIGVKDNISTQEFPTCMGADSAWSNQNMGFDARLVAIARESGAVIAGKTKTSEFAVHKETNVINPKFPGCTAGTSSAGSAAAVANGTIDLALATQTAGSIARPASYCGVIGFKPTYGDWPRTGVLKTTDDFDSLGIMGRDPEIIKDFYIATRLSGKDYPILESRRQRNEIRSAVLLVGEEFDSCTQEIMNLAIDFYEKRILSHGFNPISPKKFLDFPKIRKAHETIYRRDLMYYFKEEISAEIVSQELMDFIDLHKAPSLHEYQESKSFLYSWKADFQKRFQNTLIVSLAASTSAPVKDVSYEIDLNAAITAAGFPQLSIPAFSDKENKNLNISISSSKGCDIEILDLGVSLLKTYNEQDFGI